MANVLNRTTKVFLKSANTPLFPVTEWIINPDMAAVAGFDSRYWRILGDTVTLMLPSERAVVDARAVSDTRDEVAAGLDSLESITRAFALVVLDEINTLRATHNLVPRTIQQLKAAVRRKLGS